MCISHNSSTCDVTRFLAQSSDKSKTFPLCVKYPTPRPDQSKGSQPVTCRCRNAKGLGPMGRSTCHVPPFLAQLRDPLPSLSHVTPSPRPISPVPAYAETPQCGFEGKSDIVGRRTIWKQSQCSCPLPSECGTCTTVRTRIWSSLSDRTH